MDGNSEWSESRPDSGPDSPDIYDRTRTAHPLIHPAALHHLRPPAGSPPDSSHLTPGVSTNPNVINKPRIWSLADMASKENKDDHHSPHGMYSSSHGKILSPLAGRMPIHPSPYVRPEFYRNFYGPAAAHLSAHPHDAALLESYQRSFNASLAQNGLASMNPLSVMSKSPLTPLSLATNSTIAPPSGHSPSASSTSSGPDHPMPSADKLSPGGINVTKP